jgi:hypothetical protein
MEPGNVWYRYKEIIMKGVDNKLACGTFIMIYFNLLLTVQIITGFEIIANVIIFSVLVIAGLPIIFFIGNKVSKGYDKDNNNDKVYYIIITILIGLFLFLVQSLAEKYTQP